MPRHDWYNDDTMDRDRSERGLRDHDRDRGAIFGRDRDDDRGFGRDRDERGYGRDRDDGRGRRMGGWGGLMNDDRDRHSRDRSPTMGRDRDRDRDRDWDRDDHFGSDDHNRGVPMDETRRMIASNKVEGTPVYDRHGDKLGTVHNFMVDKFSGQVSYAVLKHSGGFLGLNERYYPLQWDMLDYDTRLSGYALNMDEEDLKSFGSFDREGRWKSRTGSSDRDRGRRDRW